MKLLRESDRRYLKALRSFKDGFSFLKSALGRAIFMDAAMEDEDVWRTTEEGKHFKFDNETGEVKAGFGGRYNGKKIGESWKAGKKSSLSKEQQARIDNLKADFKNRTTEQIAKAHERIKSNLSKEKEWLKEYERMPESMKAQYEEQFKYHASAIAPLEAQSEAFAEELKARADVPASSSQAEPERSESASNEKQDAWAGKLSAEREQTLSLPQSKQALFAYKAGVAEYDEAVEAMRNGTASDLVGKYYGIMEHNGDPTPDKPLSKQMDSELYDSIRSGKYSDYESARVGMIGEKTGQSAEEAKKTYDQLHTWFGGSWDRADTAAIDRYIDQDDVYDGPIYRGMHFSEQEYSGFMQGLKPGERINMRGMNSSWTDNEEVAYNFYRNGERKVKITCLKNRTAAPVSHLSDKGENEVIAHSKAEWTVLSVSEGSDFTEIKVVETGSFMSDQKRDALKKKGSTHDAMPEKESSGSKPLFERMQEQQTFMSVDPESKAFADELEKKYPGAASVYKRSRTVSSKDADLTVFIDDDDPFDDEI